MEYLLIILVGDEKGGRDVLVDGQPNGETSSVIGIGAGTYTISLDGAANYRPSQQQVTVSGTNPRQPLVVFFETI